MPRLQFAPFVSIKGKPAMGGGKTSVFKSKIIIITKKIIKIIKQ